MCPGPWLMSCYKMFKTESGSSGLLREDTRTISESYIIHAPKRQQLSDRESGLGKWKLLITNCDVNRRRFFFQLLTETGISNRVEFCRFTASANLLFLTILLVNCIQRRKWGMPIPYLMKTTKGKQPKQSTKQI